MVEFKSKLNKEMIAVASENNFKKAKKTVAILSILFVIGGVALIAVNFSDFFLKDDNSSMLPVLFGIFFFVFGLLFYPNFTRKYKENLESVEKNSELIGDECEITYKFDKDKFYVFVVKGEKYRSAVESDYSCIVKVIEDDEKYLIFMGQNQIDVVMKKDLILGSLEELTEILKTNINQKYQRVVAKK